MPHRVCVERREKRKLLEKDTIVSLNSLSLTSSGERKKNCPVFAIVAIVTTDGLSFKRCGELGYRNVYISSLRHLAQRKRIL